MDSPFYNFVQIVIGTNIIILLYLLYLYKSNNFSTIPIFIVIFLILQFYIYHSNKYGVKLYLDT
jgi:hypothetical protein